MSRYIPDNRYSVGTSAGIHPEDRPTATSPYPDDAEEPQTRLPSSQVRYARGTNFVMQMTDHTTEEAINNPHVKRASRIRAQTTTPTQRKKQPAPQLPPPREKPAPRRRVLRHPLVIALAIGVALTLGIWIVETAITIGTNTRNQLTYGYPRTFQVDQDVGHGGISHFTVENLHGKVIIYETLHNDLSKSHVYVNPLGLKGDNADLYPITLEFRDVTGHGMLDMILIQNGQEWTVFPNNADGSFHLPAS